MRKFAEVIVGLAVRWARFRISSMLRNGRLSHLWEGEGRIMKCSLLLDNREGSAKSNFICHCFVFSIAFQSKFVNR